MLTQLAITVGEGRRNPVGKYCRLDVTAGIAEALAAALRGVTGSDGWWSGHLFAENRRQESKWRAAAVAMVDIDYHELGSKKPTPPATVVERLVSAARDSLLPGNLFHPTPHGARVALILDSIVDDPALMKSVIRGACQQVQRALEALSLHEQAGTGYVVDSQATDLARFMFGPRALVDGQQRNAEITVMRSELYLPASLVAHAASTVATPAVRDDAASKWSADHPIDYPRPGAGDCPICGGKGGFGQLPERPGKWFCWHVTHEGGHKTERGHFGDSLDIEAHRRGVTRQEVLRADGYLAPICGSRTASGKTCAATDLLADGKCSYHTTQLRVVADYDDSPAAIATPTLLPLVTLGDIPEPGPVEWLVRDLWTLGAFGFVGAEPKSWKSWVTLHLAISIASGEPFLGKYEVTKGRVMMFTAEGGTKLARRRAGQICRAMGIDLKSLPITLIDLPTLYLDDPKQMAALVATVAHHRPSLLVCDPFREMHRADENDAAVIASLMAPLRELRAKTGCSVMLVHHMGKAPSDGKYRRGGQRMRGSSALHGAVDSALYLFPNGQGVDKRVSVEIEHREAEEPEPFKLKLRDQALYEGKGTWLELDDEKHEEQEVEESAATLERLQKAVLKAVRWASMPGRTPFKSANAIALAVKGTKGAVLRIVKTMLLDGVLVKDDRGCIRVVEEDA